VNTFLIILLIVYAMQKEVVRYHPNAYLEHKRNVTQGLQARTKILEVIDEITNIEGRAAGRKLTIKAVSKSAALSYASSLHHLRLLEQEQIVIREGKRPYRWKVTGKGQTTLAEIGLDLEKANTKKEERNIPNELTHKRGDL